jgi:SH3 domain protein
MIKIILTGLVFLLVNPNLLAQETEEVNGEIRDIWYVTDQLRLSVYPQASDKSGSLQLLSSGDKLAIIQISGNYALVVTPNGKQGWVKRGFLVPEPTASLLLKQEKLKNQVLNQEIEKLANSKMVIDQYEVDMDAMSENFLALEAKNEQFQQTIAELEQAAQLKADMEATIAASVESNMALPIKALLTTAMTYWQYMIPLVVLFLLVGFLTGKMFIEARIRKRFHGIKVW